MLIKHNIHNVKYTRMDLVEQNFTSHFYTVFISVSLETLYISIYTRHIQIKTAVDKSPLKLFNRN